MQPETKHFVELLPEPTFLLTPGGQIVLANQAAGRLAGQDRRGLAGQEFANLLLEPWTPVAEYLRLCARSRQLLPGSISLRVAGHGPMDLRCDGALVETRSATAPGLIFLRCRPRAEASEHFNLLNRKINELSREVLERRKAERHRDELLEGERLARAEAERASQMKDEFLATLSHELRTPLNAILGWTSILERENLSPDASEGVRVIGRNARVQTQLIEDLLDMSRIISGKIRLDVQHVTLATVIEAAVAAIRPTAELKEVRLQVLLDPIAGPVMGDPSRLQQIVWNLLSNAVKFTPVGGRIQVALERVNSHVEISVADNGSGIKPEFLPHVFDRFQQGDSSSTRRFGGLGLGLSIARQLVELHGGSIRAKSPGPGQGATFHVALPVVSLQASPEESRHSRVHPAGFSLADSDPCAMQDLTGIKVLLVEDEPDARALVKKLLEDCHAEVWAAASAAAGLEILRDRVPDLIVSDIGMPDEDGYQFIRAVRSGAAEHGAKIPAIALTAFSRSEDRMRSMIAGYNLHLAKPVEPRELIIAVASLSARLEGAGRAASAQPGA